MKAWIGVVALVLMLGSGVTIANTSTDGYSLLKGCQVAIKVLDKETTSSTAPEIISMGHCIGTIEGVIGTMDFLADKVADDYKVCLPKEGVNNEQGVRIVFKFLRRNQEKLNLNSTFLTMLALRNAFPCKK